MTVSVSGVSLPSFSAQGRTRRNFLAASMVALVNCNSVSNEKTKTLSLPLDPQKTDEEMSRSKNYFSQLSPGGVFSIDSPALKKLETRIRQYGQWVQGVDGQSSYWVLRLKPFQNQSVSARIIGGKTVMDKFAKGAGGIKLTVQTPQEEQQYFCDNTFQTRQFYGVGLPRLGVCVSPMPSHKAVMDKLLPTLLTCELDPLPLPAKK